MIKILGIHIKNNDIERVSDDLEFLVVKNKREYHTLTEHSTRDKYLTINIKNDSMAPQIKSLLINRALKEESPQGRVCNFEWWPDTKERQRLERLRTTKKEKDEHKKDLIESIQDYKKIGLETDFLEKELEEHMKGTFRGD